MIKTNLPKIIVPKDMLSKKAGEIKTSSTSSGSADTANSEGKISSGSTSSGTNNTTFYNYTDEELGNESSSANTSNILSGSALKTAEPRKFFNITPGTDDIPSAEEKESTMSIPRPVTTKLSFLDFDPVEIANQLTYIEFDLFKVIKVLYLYIYFYF